MAVIIFPSTNDVGGGQTITEDLFRKLVQAYGDNWISGFDPPAVATGLSYTVPAGEQILQGRYVQITTGTAVTFTANATNYCWLQLTLDASSNATNASIVITTTSTNPGNAVLLWTVTTDASSVTSVSDERVHVESKILDVTGGAYVRINRDGTHIYHRDSGGNLKFFQYYDPALGDWRLYSNSSSVYIGMKTDGSLYSSKPAATGYTRVTPNFCFATSRPAGSLVAKASSLQPHSVPSGAKAVYLELEYTNTEVVYIGYGSNILTQVSHSGSGYQHVMAPVYTDGNVYMHVVLSGADVNYRVLAYWD